MFRVLGYLAMNTKQVQTVDGINNLSRTISMFFHNLLTFYAAVCVCFRHGSLTYTSSFTW